MTEGRATGRRKWWPTGLQARLAVVLAVAVTPGIVLALVEADRNRDRSRASAESELSALAERAANTEQQLIDEARSLLQVLGSIPDVRDRTPGRCEAVLAELPAGSPGFFAFGAVGSDGLLTCSSVPLNEPVSLADRDWFGTALETRDFTLSDYLVGRVTGEGTRVAAQPVLDETGEVSAIVTAGINLDWVASLLDGADLPEGSVITMIDSQGTVVARSPDEENGYVGTTAADNQVAREILARGGSGLVTVEGLDGVTRLHAYAPLAAPASGYVYAGMPRGVAFADADARFRATALALLVAAVVIFAAALLLARVTVLARLRAVTQVARRLTAGERDARTGLRGSGEIAEVGAALDSLADALQQRAADLRRTAGALVAAQEEERGRIATEVHDDSVQVMTAHLLGLQLLHRRLSGTEHEPRVAELEQSAAGAIDRLRRLIFELHPPELTDRGLAPALRTLVARSFEGTDTEVDLDVALPEEPPPPTAAVAYRVAQEALSNVRRHAGAHRVHVGLRRDQNATLVLTVADDGAGFTPSVDDRRPGHRGLVGMRDRAALVGGEVLVETLHGGGTTVRLRVPWYVGETLGANPGDQPVGSPATSRTTSPRPSSPEPFAT